MAWDRHDDGGARSVGIGAEVDLDAFAAAARAIVAGQKALDERFHEAFARFEETGMPAAALAWSSLRLRFGVAARFAGKSSASGATRLLVAPAGSEGSRIVVSLRQLPPEEESLPANEENA